jgi:hypothetical protein
VLSRTLIVFDGQDPLRVTSVTNRGWIRLLCHGLSFSLDRRIASGRPVESSALLAARAQILTSPVKCQQVAEAWQVLIDLARSSDQSHNIFVTVCRDRLASAEHDIRQLSTILLTSQPVAARGVAIAKVLLADGTGPVFNPHSDVSLRTALGQAIEQLDPCVALTAWQ